MSGERPLPPRRVSSGSPYRDAAHLQALLAEVLMTQEENSGAPTDTATPLTQRHLAVAFDFTDPVLTVVVDGRSGHTVEVGFGPVVGVPLIFSMDGETAHAFWLGELNVVTAMTIGKIRLQGSLLHALSIAPMMPALQRRYRALWLAQS